MNLKRIFKAALGVWSAAAVTSAASLAAFADGTASSGSNTAATGGSGWGMLISLAIIFVLMYFLMIRPQKKKEKETKAMQDNIEIGDEIVTIGGIVGMVLRKGEDNVVIETGGERNKMRIKLWAISENTSAVERAKEAKAAAAAAKKDGDPSVTAAAVVDDESTGKKKKKKADKE
ncbi:MAG: preprotein translocase subunit YajC [Ruminococcus sp.]|nr:preprotein translocase subunit YajC [Oscillospiraceae bacterium]